MNTRSENNYDEKDRLTPILFCETILDVYKRQGYGTYTVWKCKILFSAR